MSLNLKTGSILYGRTFDVKNKHDEQVLCSLVTIKQVDGTISKVFAYGEDITQKDVIFCNQITHGQPLYEDGPLSEPGKDLVFEGTASVQKLGNVNTTLEVCKEFSL